MSIRPKSPAALPETEELEAPLQAPYPGDGETPADIPEDPESERVIQPVPSND